MFLYQLGLARGGQAPSQFLRELRPSELGYYWALWQIDPWGEQRADLRSGIVASTIANVHRDSRKVEPFRPAQFMPYHREAPPPPAVVSQRLLQAFGLELDPKRIRKK